MRSLTSRMKAFGDGISKHFSAGLGHLAGPLSLGAAIEAIGHTLTKVQSIQREAESLGISTSFAQDLNNIGGVAGIAGEKMEKMLGKFLQGLPVGADLEQQFYKLADKIKGIEDPGDRARAAVDAFGKSGVKMISILEKGSAALRMEAAQFSRFNDSEIAALEQTKMELEKFENFFSVWIGKIVHSYGQFGSIIGHISSQFGKGKTITQALLEGLAEEGAKADAAKAAAGLAFAQNKLGEALARQKAEDDKITAAKDLLYSKQQEKEYKNADDPGKLDILENKKLALLIGQSMTDDEAEFYGWAVKILDVEEKIDSVKKHQTKEMERQAKAVEQYGQKLQDAVAKQEAAAFNLNRERSDFSKLSLDDLASSKFDRTATTWGIGGGRSFTIESPLTIMARQAQKELEMAQEGRAWGDTAGAEFHQKRYEDLVKNNPALKDAIRNPYEKLEAAVNEQTDKLERLLDQDGIVVREFDPVDE